MGKKYCGLEKVQYLWQYLWCKERQKVIMFTFQIRQNFELMLSS